MNAANGGDRVVVLVRYQYPVRRAAFLLSTPCVKKKGAAMVIIESTERSMLLPITAAVTDARRTFVSNDADASR